jgi:hypothetical protein
VTTHTRRRVIVGAVALLLTLPTETILLKALATPTPKQAAQQWVSSLSPSQLSSAAASIQSYPFAYRKAIMAALPPATQSAVWQSYIESYLAANPGIEPAAASALQSALAFLTPEALSQSPTDAERAQIHAIAAQVTASLGKDTALDLLYRLGPADGAFSSAEPVTQKLADFVRRSFTLYAGGGSDCECNTGWGCDGATKCSSSVGCTTVTSWPACGWLWEDPCDGGCIPGS